MIHNLEERLRSHFGPFTEELKRCQGKHHPGQVPLKDAPDAVSSSVCGFCSTGCSLKIHLRNGNAVNLTPETNYPVNLGMACPKGWESLTPLAASDRATTPLYRKTRNENPAPLDWNEAAEVFCDRMKQVQKEHGPESVAFLGTGQICTEELALLGAFAKFEMGVIHGDGNTRQCMATAVSAYKESFGFDAPPYTYDDFEQSDVIVLIGSNLCVAHPIMWQRILLNPNNPELIVFDPRTTETAMQATQHVPLQPKSDLTLFYGIARELIRKGYIDKDYIDIHTTGFEDFSRHVDPFDLETVSNTSGIPIAELERIVETIGQGKRVSFWWTMGVNQGHEATRTAQAIINLALMTGNIGRPGTGANSITGQCNAMGSRLFSNTSSLFGGRDFSSSTDRKEIAEIVGIDEERIQKRTGMAYDQIIDGIESGAIKALWVVATNGAHSWFNQSRFRKLLDKLDFLVVQDMYCSTETAVEADLILPAAGWGEKEGTFINSERRIGKVNKVSTAPGSALADFNIIRLLGSAWGAGEWFEKWSSPEAVFQIMKKMSRATPCDFSGIKDYHHIEDSGGIQWPCPEEAKDNIQVERRLFEDGKFYTKDQRAKFVFDNVQPVPERPDSEYPFILLTGRGSSGQWHTQTRTGKSGILRKLNPTENYIEIHPGDAADLGLDHHGMVNVASRRGSCTVKCLITPNVAPGQVFMPMHFTETNRLTNGIVDPHSRQPSYKHCAVQISASGL
ncbi:MAG: nitrate reductase [Verrucomicrobiales bacterium]|nr:nitrate reductase [Verrucomicrobiales bacterium]